MMRRNNWQNGWQNCAASFAMCFATSAKRQRTAKHAILPCFAILFAARQNGKERAAPLYERGARFADAFAMVEVLYVG